MAYTKGKVSPETIAAMRPGDVIYEPGGLMARCGAKGVSLSVKASIHGKQRVVTIGRYGHGGLTLAGARKRATEIQGTVAGGHDPSQPMRDRRAAARFTIADLAAEFDAAHIRRLKPKSAHGYRYWLTKRILPNFGAMPVRALARPAIRAWHHAGDGTPAASNSALRVLNKLLSFAVQEGYRDDHPGKGIKQYALQKRERYLSPEETARMWAAIDAMERETAWSPTFLAGIRLLLLTGARWSEIFEAEWSWLDRDHRQIRVPDVHAKVADRVIRLSDDAMRILDGIPRIAGHRHIIAGTRPGRPYGAKSRPWAELLGRAGIEKFRPHDMRHSWAADAASNGASLPLIGAHLGHKSPQTTARYAHLMPDATRDLADAVSNRIAAKRHATKATDTP